MRILIIFCLFLLCNPIQAAQPITAELLSEPFRESYQPEVKVSGNVIVGVMSGAAQAALREDRLGVRVDSAMAGAEVCVRATSNDGIYQSRNHYRLPAATERAHLPYASGMGDVLGGFGPHGLAVSVSTGDCEATAAGTFLVAGAVDEAAATPVTLFVNGFGATDVFVAVGDDADLEPCEYIDEGRRTTYDFYCTLASVPAQSRSVTIVRERFGREQPEISLKLIGLGE